MRNLTLLLAILASGCLKQISLNRDPTVTNPQVSQVAISEVVWRTPLVKLGLLEYLPQEPASPAVDPDTERVFVTTRDGWLRCLNPDTGNVEWEFQSRGKAFAGPVVSRGVLYFAGGDGVLYAFRALSGEKLWEFDANEELVTTPTVTADFVYVASQSEAVFAVEKATGTWKWQYRRDAPAGFTVRGTSQPVYANGHVYIGFSDGYLVAIEADTCVPTWEKRITVTGGTQFLDVDSTPVLQDGKIFVTSYKDGVTALDAKDGALLWSTPHAGLNALMARGKVLFATGDGSLTAFEMDHGRELWSLDLSEPTSKGKGQNAGRAMTWSRGYVVVPTSTALAFVNPITARVAAMWNPGRGVTGVPAAFSSARNGGRMYVLNNYGTVYALQMVGGPK